MLTGASSALAARAPRRSAHGRHRRHHDWRWPGAAGRRAYGIGLQRQQRRRRADLELCRRPVTPGRNISQAAPRRRRIGWRRSQVEVADHADARCIRRPHGEGRAVCTPSNSAASRPAPSPRCVPSPISQTSISPSTGRSGVVEQRPLRRRPSAPQAVVERGQRRAGAPSNSPSCSSSSGASIAPSAAAATNGVRRAREEGAQLHAAVGAGVRAEHGEGVAMPGVRRSRCRSASFQQAQSLPRW